MATITTPDAVPGELIQASWGDAVRVDLNALNNTKVNLAGDTLTGRLIVGGDPNVFAAGCHLETTGRIQGMITDPAAASMILERLNSANGERFATYRRRASAVSTDIGSVSQASATSVAFNTTSDRRLKQVTGDVADAADIVATLGALAYRGRWIADEGDGAEWVFLNSQDVEGFAPYAVFGAPDGVAAADDAYGREAGTIIPQQLDHGALVPLLFAALAQALDRIAALEGAAP